MQIEKYHSDVAHVPREKTKDTAQIEKAEHTIQKTIKKSDNAIEYFAKTPDKADVKFVFCKPTTF